MFTPPGFAFARDGISVEADSNEETVLICDLDLDSLHTSRSAGTVTSRLDRRPDLFQFVSTFNPNSEIGMGSAAAPAAVRRALAPNSEASENPERLEHFAQPGEPRGRGSLRPRRTRSPKPTSEIGFKALAPAANPGEGGPMGDQMNFSGEQLADGK